MSAIAPESIKLLELPKLPTACNTLLPEIAAVYIVFTETEEVLYIGQSVNLKHRWTSHNRIKEFIDITNTWVAWIEVESKQLMALERLLIKYFNPKLNQQHKPVPQKKESNDGLVILLKQIREEQSLSINKLAILTGLSPQQIHRLETGESWFSRESLEKICIALDCQPGDLIDRKAIAHSLYS